VLAERYRIVHRDATPPRATYFLAQGGRLHCLDWLGSGETIVFLHGGALTAHTWDLVCLGMRDEWRCLALDLRGHGDSDWADEYLIETAVDDVIALISHHGLQRAHLVGNSLGGIIAAHVAATHPQHIASLTLVDVGPKLDFMATQRIRDYIDETDGLADLSAAIDAGMAANPRIDRDALMYRLTHSMRQADDQRVYWKQDRRRMGDHGYFIGKVTEIAQRTSEITAPVLVLRGARSRVFSDEAASACAASFPNGRWVRIESAGHNVQESNPAALIAALKEFLSR